MGENQVEINFTKSQTSNSMSSIYRKFFSPPREQVLKKSRYGKKQIEQAQRLTSNDIYRERSPARVRNKQSTVIM